MAVMYFVFFISACSEVYNPEENEGKSNYNIIDLGENPSKYPCVPGYIGDVLFVGNSSETYVCNGERWVPLKTFGSSRDSEKTINEIESELLKNIVKVVDSLGCSSDKKCTGVFFTRFCWV